MFYVCGFVPWHVRRLNSTGDLVPEVIPLGTFSWYVELRTEKERRRRNDRSDKRMRMSYVPAIVDSSKKQGHWGKEWKNDPPTLREDEDQGTKDDNVEIGHPAGSKSVRQDAETKYVQYRVRINDGGLKEEVCIPHVHAHWHTLTNHDKRRKSTSTTLCLPSTTSVPTP